MSNQDAISSSETYRIWVRYENACVIAQESGNRIMQQEAFKLLRYTLNKFFLHCHLRVKDVREIEDNLSQVERINK